MPGADRGGEGVNVADTILKRRSEMGLTLKELSKRSGVAVRTIGDWESGKRSPSVERLAWLLEALELKMEIKEVDK